MKLLTREINHRRGFSEAVNENRSWCNLRDLLLSKLSHDREIIVLNAVCNRGNALFSNP